MSGEKKTNMFKFLVDRICSKVSGWNNNLLSSAGKEILIKSILQALPQYIMMAYKIPQSLCKRLWSIVMRYWWSHFGKKSIHWADQFLLNRTKENGGMSFKDFEVMNDAFLLKQVWRLLSNSSSLTCQWLKVS